jgi:hypothetical protein
MRVRLRETDVEPPGPVEPERHSCEHSKVDCK